MMTFSRLSFLLFVLFSCDGRVFNGILPGSEPNTHQKGDGLRISSMYMASKVTPLVYDYFDLPFCKERNSNSQGGNKPQNIGESMSGDIATITPYKLNMLESTTCQVLCRKQYDKEDLDKFKGFIEKKYFAHWILEGLPVISRKPADISVADSVDTVERGFPLGFTYSTSIDGLQRTRHFLNNHIRIVIKVSSDEEIVQSESMEKHRFRSRKLREGDYTTAINKHDSTGLQGKLTKAEHIEEVNEESENTHINSRLLRDLQSQMSLLNRKIRANLKTR